MKSSHSFLINFSGLLAQLDAAIHLLHLQSVQSYRQGEEDCGEGGHGAVVRSLQELGSHLERA